ncbi:hypothetical protein RIF29_46571 [Crotalaria pallida]|uniref:Photosystem II cytochrome b559 N-terminal domain-containing protein n=1 Tax=Crotalaria pallida TaxID=3830 RepID=A0AAN9DSW2_CROPI
MESTPFDCTRICGARHVWKQGERSFADIITSIRYWIIHSITIPPYSLRVGYFSSNDKPNPNYRATTQSNPNEQNVELNRTSLYWGTVTGITVIGLIGIFFYGSYSGLGSSLYRTLLY